MSMILLKNGLIFAPEPLGIKDILLGNGKIIGMEGSIDLGTNVPYEVVDLEGLYVFPGIIDAHVHIAGAGGEGGPASRTPEMKIDDMIRSGITTVIGCLGTDGITRSVESVLMKVKSIRD